MSSSTHLPILFTIPPSNRHEFLLIDTSAKVSLKALNKQITATVAQSPNCAEFMAKHKAKDGPAEQIQEFKIHWDMKNRDAKLWPEHTVVTDDNFGAIIEILRGNPTMGVLEIKLGKDA